MTEERLQRVERELAAADAESAAAVAFAAVYRIGELGAAAGEEFARLAESYLADPDVAGLVAVGWTILAASIDRQACPEQGRGGAPAVALCGRCQRAAIDPVVASCSDADCPLAMRDAA